MIKNSKTKQKLYQNGNKQINDMIYNNGANKKHMIGILMINDGAAGMDEMVDPPLLLGEVLLRHLQLLQTNKSLYNLSEHLKGRLKP